MCAPIHRLPLVSRPQSALQENGDMPDVRQDQERLSDLSVGLGVR